MDIQDGVIRVELDEKTESKSGSNDSVSNRIVEFNIKEYDNINHGYAVTFNKAQGATVNNSIVIPTVGMSVNQFAVALTRHKDNCVILVDREQYGDINEIHGQAHIKGNVVDYVPNEQDRQFKVIVDEYYHMLQAQGELIAQISTSQLDEEKFLKNSNQKQASKQEAIASNILQRQYGDMAELKTQIKEQAGKIVENWGNTRSFAALYGYRLESLQIIAGVREKLYSSLELKAKEEVQGYIELVDRSRELMAQMQADGYSGGLRQLHPKNTEYEAIKGNLGYVSHKMSNNPILYKQFFTVEERGEKLVDQFGGIRENEGINRPVYWASVVYGDRAFRLDTAHQRFVSSYDMGVKGLVQEYLQARAIVGSIVAGYTQIKEDDKTVDWNSLREGKWASVYKDNEVKRNELAYELVKKLDQKAGKSDITVGDLLWASVGLDQIKEFELLKQDGVATPEQYGKAITTPIKFSMQLVDQAIIHEYHGQAHKFNSTLSLYVKAGVGNTLLKNITSEIGQNKWVNYCRLKENAIRHVDLRFYGHFVSGNLEDQGITQTVDQYVKYNDLSARMGEIWSRAERNAGIEELKVKISYRELEVKDSLVNITGKIEGITTYLYDLSMDVQNQSIAWRGDFKNHYMNKYGSMPRNQRPDWFNERSLYNAMKTQEYVAGRFKQDFKTDEVKEVVQRYMVKYDLEQEKLQKVWGNVPQELYLKLKEERGQVAHELLQDKKFAGFVGDYREEYKELKNIETHAGEYSTPNSKTKSVLQNSDTKETHPNKEIKHTYYDADRIKELMNEHIVDIADMAFSGAKKQVRGRYVMYGNKGSMRIDTARGLFNDWESGIGGDALKLYQTHFVRGDNYRELLEAASNWLGGVGVTAKTTIPKISQASIDKEKETKQAGVQRLYKVSQPIQNSLAETYLNKHRDISQTKDLKDVRFIDEYKSKGEIIPPRLVSFARDKQGEITGCQSIYLDQTTGDKNKSVEIVKKSQGSIAGSFVELQADEGHIGKTFVAEGLETAMSIKETGVKGRIICSLGISNLKNLNVHEHSRVIISADNDFHKKTSKTHEVIDKAVDKLEEQGAKVEVIRPYSKGQDFNDILQDKGMVGVSRYVSKHLLEDKAREDLLSDKQSLLGKLDNLNNKGLGLVAKGMEQDISVLTKSMDKLHLSFSVAESPVKNIKSLTVDESKSYDMNRFAFKDSLRENLTTLKEYQYSLEEKAMSGTLASHMAKLRSPEFIAEMLKPNNENRLYDYAREGVELPIEAIDMEKFKAQTEEYKKECGTTSLANSIDKAVEVVANGWQLESLSQSYGKEAVKTLTGDSELDQIEGVSRKVRITQTFATDTENKEQGKMWSQNGQHKEEHKILASEITNLGQELTEINSKLTQNQAGQDMIRASNIDELAVTNRELVKQMADVETPDIGAIAKKSAEYIYYTNEENLELSSKQLNIINKCSQYAVEERQDRTNNQDNKILDFMENDRITSIEMRLMVDEVKEHGKISDIDKITETAVAEYEHNQNAVMQEYTVMQDQHQFSDENHLKIFTHTMKHFEERYGEKPDEKLTDAIKTATPIIAEIQEKLYDRELENISDISNTITTKQEELIQSKVAYQSRAIGKEIVNSIIQDQKITQETVDSLVTITDEKYDKEINIDISKQGLQDDFGPKMRR